MTSTRLDGDLTLARMPALLPQANELAQAASIDLAGVGRVDSAGLAFLLELTRRAQAAPGGFALIHPPASLRSLADYFNLGGILPFASPDSPA